MLDTHVVKHSPLPPEQRTMGLWVGGRYWVHVLYVVVNVPDQLSSIVPYFSKQG